MGNSNNKDVKINTHNVAKQAPRATAQTSDNEVVKIVTCNVTKQTPNAKTQTSNSTVWKPSSASIISSVKPPQPFSTEEEFFQKWSLWRNDFLIYRKILNDGKPDHGNWGDKLLNIMGPIGQQIYNRFTFICSDNRKDLDILLTKFDQYCAFEGRKKKVQEDIYMYIHDLQLKAKEGNIENAEELIRKKILKEIDEYMFTNAAKRLIPSFQLSSDFNKLTLKEIAFIWKLYDQNSVQSCYRCGSNHSNETCPALGKQCSKCKELNHFRPRCPLIFLSDCQYCGDAHFKKQCPAYNEICTKCKKLNHFSWKCQSAQILQCQFCGLTHAASKTLCPAINSFCIFCKTTGHFASKCKKKAHSNKH